eukprot:4375959-Amphidinium_carterae.1
MVMVASPFQSQSEAEKRQVEALGLRWNATDPAVDRIRHTRLEPMTLPTAAPHPKLQLVENVCGKYGSYRQSNSGRCYG